MAIINKGKSFANGEQLTADKLNQVIDNATFTTSSVDNVSTQLSGGSIVVKDGGVTTAKLNDGAVTTAKIADANVTFAKLTDVIDDDTMATASATKLATSESIKAYVDEYALKYSGATGTFNATTSFQDLDLSSIVGVNLALVVMEVYDSSSLASLLFKQKSSSIETVDVSSSAGYGASGLATSTLNKGGSIVVVTDSAGVIEYKAGSAQSGINYKILCYQKLA